MILVDTSVWIDLLSKSPTYHLTTEDLFLIATTPPIVQELLQGFRLDDDLNRFEDRLLALPCIPSSVTLDTYRSAAGVNRQGRRRGLTIRSPIDCLIAAIAIENDLTVWHKNRDFEMIATYTDLKVVDKIR